MHRRRSNPSGRVAPQAVHATRRAGPRRDSTQRVLLRAGGLEIGGWTLNISSGGARLVVEQPVEPGMLGTLQLDGRPTPRRIRVVWVQDEADGQIVGLAYLDGEAPDPASSEASKKASRPK